MEVSFIIPVYNEYESLNELVTRLLKEASSYAPFEIIFIDDGSNDGSAKKLDELQQANPQDISVIHLRCNCGKALALQAGFNAAKGKYVMMLDSDLQDQPEEIHKLFDKLKNDGLDAITGWKKIRHDPKWSKNIPSRMFNAMVQHISGLYLHDFNCGMKLFKKDCLENVNIYGQLHRFILVLVFSMGFKVGEVAIEHAPRKFGESKFGAKRFYHGFMDILTILFITRFRSSPLYFFGLPGSIALLTSLPVGLYYIGAHLYGISTNNPQMFLAEHPAWLISPALFLLGLVMFFFGLIGEMLLFHTLPKKYPDAYIRHINKNSN